MPNYPKALELQDAHWLADLCGASIAEKGWDSDSLASFFNSGGYGYALEKHACILLKGAEGYAELVLLATHPDYQQKGSAKKLWGHAIYNTALSEVVLEVSEKNHTAIRCYETFGFEKVGVRKSYYKDGSNAFTMRWQAS